MRVIAIFALLFATACETVEAAPTESEWTLWSETICAAHLRDGMDICAIDRCFVLEGDQVVYAWYAVEHIGTFSYDPADLVERQAAGLAALDACHERLDELSAWE